MKICLTKIFIYATISLNSAEAHSLKQMKSTACFPSPLQTNEGRKRAMFAPENQRFEERANKTNLSANIDVSVRSRLFLPIFYIYSRRRKVRTKGEI